MLLHIDMLQGIRLCQGPCCPKGDCHLSCRNIAGGQTPTCLGCSNSFSGREFVLHKWNTYCHDSQHSRGMQVQLSYKEIAHFPLLWDGGSRLCRKPLPQANTGLVNGA